MFIPGWQNNFAFEIPSTPYPVNSGSNLDPLYFAASGYKEFPKLYLGQAGISDYLKSVEVDVENASANDTVTVKYRVNGATSWTTLGSAITSNGRTEIDFPADVVASREVEVRLDLVNDRANAPITVRRLAINVVERPKKNTVYVLPLLIAPLLPNHTGAEMIQDAETALDRLFDIEELETTVEVLLPNGRRYNALVIDVSPTKRGFVADQQGYVQADVMLQVMSAA